MNSSFPVIEGYELHRIVGRGGAATVYQAHDERHGRQVAIKIIDGDKMSESQQRAFTREVRAMGRLGDHPNVATIFDSGILDDGRAFLIMPLFVDGSLSAQIKLQGPLPVESLLSVGVKIASALETAHQRGILHCDVKPSNVLLGPWHEPQLSDFGISSVSASGVTTTGTSSMTVAFAAPEIIEDHPPSVATDIYSLGATLFNLAQGQPPFRGSTPAATVRQVIEAQGPPPLEVDVPEAFRALIADTMARDPQHRPATAAEVADRLREIQRSLGHPETPGVFVAEGAARQNTSVRPEPVVHQAWVAEAPEVSEVEGAGASEATTPADRRRVGLIVAAVAACLLVALGGWFATRDDNGATAVGEADPTSNEPSPDTVDTSTIEEDEEGAATSSGPALFDETVGGRPNESGAIHPGGVWDLDWSPLGFVASGGDDGVVRLWTPEGELLNELFHTPPVRDVAWSPDGSRLAVADDEEVRIWDLEAGTSVVLPESFRQWRVSWSDDGQTIAGGGWFHVRWWDAVSLEVLQLYEVGEHTIWSVDLDRDANTIAALSGEANLYEWQLDDPNTLLRREAYADETYDGTVRYLDDSTLLVGTVGQAIRLYDRVDDDASASNPDARREIADDWFPLIVEASPDGETLVSLGQVSLVRFIDVETGEVLEQLGAPEDDEGATAATWSPDGNRLVTGSFSGQLYVWDTADPRNPRVLGPFGTTDPN